MEPTPVMFQQLGLAVLLGMLVGLEREHAASAGLAGMLGGWALMRSILLLFLIPIAGGIAVPVLCQSCFEGHVAQASSL